MGNVSSVKDGRRVLPGAHALPGCNTTSSFFGNGKWLVYKKLKDAASDFHDLDNLGDSDKDVAISCSSRFVARLCDQKSFAYSHHSIDAASFSILYTNLLPFPKKEEVVLHPERACAPGRTLRPSLTLLTFPIWTHSSLVFVICLSK
jgi:hypothetical protein